MVLHDDVIMYDIEASLDADAVLVREASLLVRESAELCFDVASVLVKAMVEFCFRVDTVQVREDVEVGST